ncbi:TPA: hypothetical protein ACNFOO_000048 [Acinetobacter baumannii]|uniref:hypothetical protein n=1 Tax=Acinetobacter baumannii TaxID=470 RepID=UPI0002CDF1C8|nr:hypothetical protein [Acinetobacter baumannii]ENW41779.1 hypothetical protein F919_03062 [Acinetobacter baumannii NIPH 329]MDC4479128.1 hypothetical protein [Acinetobacter baumannii]MDC4493730.1 hypothetical protein [Acinetobacter baumannii]MDC4728846.1 hypothetical protein [Acinetobacter baumannii]MDC4872223.1 hypothetical protein [Acinetobacter baumannii]
MIIQYSKGLTIEQLQNSFLLIINNKNLFDFLWEKFAKDFGHERFMTKVSENSPDYRIHIRDIGFDVLNTDLKYLPPAFLDEISSN